MPEKKKTFEEALQELEELTAKMQDSNITLDDSLKYYETGKKLVRFCEEKLREVEQKIQILNQDEKLEDFNLDDEA